MSTTELPPSQRTYYTFGGKIVKHGEVDDLVWELERECKKLGYYYSHSADAIEIESPPQQAWDYKVAEKLGLEVGYCSDHYLVVSQLSDSGNYNANRYKANIRKVLKALRSGAQLTVACTEEDCEECVFTPQQKETE